MLALLRHPLVRYVLVATPAAVLVFLLLCDLHRGWSGTVVSRRPLVSETATTQTVLIVDNDGDGVEATWPLTATEGADLVIDPTGTPPLRLPEGAPRTFKPRGALWFTVTLDDGTERTVPTTNPRALSLAVLLWLVGLAVHNMLRSGSPFSWSPGDLDLPAPQPASGQPAPDPSPSAAPRSRKGPPPPKPRRGGGRRR